MVDPVWNPAFVDPSLDSRSTSFENPTGARGAGGTAFGGRKGAPNRPVGAGERVVLADLDGPGVIRHVWMTFPPGPPERMRSLYLEVFYDAESEPSVSVPCLDFFGLPHGRPVAYSSALLAAQEGRGFNSHVPMPFRRKARVEFVNGGSRPTLLYYQVDYTRQPELPAELGYLHVSFRRENPTTVREDFTIATDLVGPGRFLGCNVGVRVIDHADWYGEGEVKVFRDGDGALPTICGTGLEDYVGSAWGLGPHAAPFGGAPLVVRAPNAVNPDFVGFYRWHLPDAIMFERDLRVTIQQIGAIAFRPGQEHELAAYEITNPVAGAGWIRGWRGLLAWGLAERVDDYCATAYVYCRVPQPVPRLDVDGALAGIDRREHEPPLPMEQLGLLSAAQ
jgi:hypothetical protein